MLCFLSVLVGAPTERLVDFWFREFLRSFGLFASSILNFAGATHACGCEVGRVTGVKLASAAAASSPANAAGKVVHDRGNPADGGCKVAGTESRSATAGCKLPDAKSKPPNAV
jgi:hypothetical protein